MRSYLKRRRNFEFFAHRDEQRQLVVGNDLRVNGVFEVMGRLGSSVRKSDDFALGRRRSGVGP